MPQSQVLLKNATIVLPEKKAEKKAILIENEHITQILSDDAADKIRVEQVLDLQGTTLFAGFIDVHNHGAIGVDVNNANAEDLCEVAKFLAKSGVTAWLPTLVPDTNENYQKLIKAIDELMKIQAGEPIAQALGVHYEGVFANEKMCGALRPQFFKSFKNGDEIRQLPKLEKGIHLTTLAPEIENGIELVKKLVRQNWLVSIGHTKANFQILEQACLAGAKHLTHFFNAMTGLHHREIGVVGWGLTNKNVTFDIIADGVHVAPEMVKFACRIKTPEKVLLISDSVAPTGLSDGDYELWGEKVIVRNGKTSNERGSIAGSVMTILDAVKMMLSLGFSEVEVSQMASANPAKLLDIEQTHGSIEVGKRADLVALDEKRNVKLCLIGGKVV
jgi:N-acetylglucosamine-6-phosphate deacetylase